jgi:hypothetical protein
MAGADVIVGIIDGVCETRVGTDEVDSGKNAP